MSFLEEGHECRDWWNRPMDWRDRRGLSVEHVKPFLMLGRRAKNKPSEAVLLCAGANLRPPTKAQRALFREYLKERRAA